jgi:hypothetical protein
MVVCIAKGHDFHRRDAAILESAVAMAGPSLAALVFLHGYICLSLFHELCCFTHCETCGYLKHRY